MYFSHSRIEYDKKSYEYGGLLVAGPSAAGEGESEHIRNLKSLAHYKLRASDFRFLIFNRM